MENTAYIHFPPADVVVQILEALAPFTCEQRDLILTVVAANPQYPLRPTIKGTHNGAFAAVRKVRRPVNAATAGKESRK